MAFGRYMGVTCFVGYPGSGKTYSMVEIACKALASGWNVWANFTIIPLPEWTGEFYRYRDIEELIVVPDGTVVLLDEAQNMFNARTWQDFPAGFLYRLSQVRKDGIEFYYSSQHEEYVDVTLRRVTENFYHCNAVFGRLFVRSLYGAYELRRVKERPRQRRLKVVRRSVAERYDTKEKVAVRRSWLLKVLELADDPFIEIPGGMRMGDLMALAKSARASLPDRATKAEIARAFARELEAAIDSLLVEVSGDGVAGLLVPGEG